MSDQDQTKEPSHRDRIRALASEGVDGLQRTIAALPESRERGYLRQEQWKLSKVLGAYQEYFSEAGQDEYIDATLLNGMRDGVFVEIGAFDGIRGSNTLFFEKFRGWTGLLVEASPLYHPWLVQNRPEMPIEQVAVGAEVGEADFVEITEGSYMMSGLLESLPPSTQASLNKGLLGHSRFVTVPTLPLEDLLRRHNLSQIDLLSIDIEGGELDALRNFPFDEFEIDIWTIEAYDTTGEIDRIMRAADYRLACHIGADQVWILK